MIPEAGGLRLAVWSGPRNISTAMLRSFGNRSDTYPCDEPLYAHYLKATGKDHPGAKEVVAQGHTDWKEVVRWLTGPVPKGKTLFYQKHMAHHLLPHMSRDWFPALRHVFLIRDPAEMLPSLDEKLDGFSIEDTGLPQQVEIFEEVQAREGRPPPVLDARDVLGHPRHVLVRLCGLIGIPFEEAMLAWSPGRRATDGIWAKHWYHNVERSIGFMPYQAKQGTLPDRLVDLYRTCKPYYELLFEQRITAG